MPPLHPIFAREIDAFEKELLKWENSEDDSIIPMFKSFLISALQRTSMSVLEEAVGEFEEHPYCGECMNSEVCEILIRNAHRSQTLSKGREIIGNKENEK